MKKIFSVIVLSLLLFIACGKKQQTNTEEEIIQLDTIPSVVIDTLEVAVDSLTNTTSISE